MGYIKIGYSFGFETYPFNCISTCIHIVFHDDKLILISYNDIIFHCSLQSCNLLAGVPLFYRVKCLICHGIHGYGLNRIAHRRETMLVRSQNNTRAE